MQLQTSYSNISEALSHSITLCEQNYSNSCYIYPAFSDFYFRHNTPTWIDIAITIYVIGFLWHEIKQGYIDGLKDYLLSWNNIVDSCMNILYIASFGLKYYVFFKVSERFIW